MRTNQLLKAGMVAFLLILYAQSIYAQDVVWKKIVAREVAINTKKDEQLKTKDFTLIDMLAQAIRDGKVTAYSSLDHNFSSKISVEQLNEIYREVPDTVTVVDPVTNTDIIKTFKHVVEVYRYRIMEEWTFDRAKGVTNIQILGIAPLTEVYGNDFEAVKALFWVKYNDAADVVIKHAKKYPEKSLIALTWNDHFSRNMVHKQTPIANTWKTRYSRFLNIDPEDTTKHHLADMSSDSTLFGLIFYATETKNASMYDSTGKKLLRSEIFPPPDTTTLIDPVTDKEVIKVIKHDLYGLKVKYKLIEEWSFDETKGNIQVKISNLVPFITRNGSEDVYWLKFEDISPILAKYEQSHYNNSLANLLYNDYFLSEVKQAKKK